MKKSDATHSADVLSALLGGLDTCLPGTRPDLADETTTFAQHLAPLLSRLPEAAPPEGLFDAIEAELDGEAEAPFQSVRAEEGVWVQRTDKVWKKVLAQDTETGRSMYLLRCLPGASIKPHIHERAEHLFILGIDLGQPYVRLQLARCLLESRGHGPTWSAPGRPKINQQGDVTTGYMSAERASIELYR